MSEVRKKTYKKIQNTCIMIKLQEAGNYMVDTSKCDVDLCYLYNFS